MPWPMSLPNFALAGSSVGKRVYTWSELRHARLRALWSKLPAQDRQDFKAECERIWREKPCAFPCHKAGWLPRWPWITEAGGYFTFASEWLYKVRGQRASMPSRPRGAKSGAVRFPRVNLLAWRKALERLSNSN